MTLMTCVGSCDRLRGIRVGMRLVEGRQGGQKRLSRGDFKAGKLELLDMIDAQEHA